MHLSKFLFIYLSVFLSIFSSMFLSMFLTTFQGLERTERSQSPPTRGGGRLGGHWSHSTCGQESNFCGWMEQKDYRVWRHWTRCKYT